MATDEVKNLKKLVAGEISKRLRIAKIKEEIKRKNLSLSKSSLPGRPRQPKL